MRTFLILLFATVFAPGAFAETKVYNSSLPGGLAGDLLVQSSVLCPSSNFQPGTRFGNATITDAGSGTVTLDDLLERGDDVPFIADLTTALGPGAFIFVNNKAEASPAPGHTALGSTAKSTGSIVWGLVGGWTATGFDYCLSSPTTVCTNNASPHGTTVAAEPPDSNTYDLGTWTFDAEGDYEAASAYINSTNNGGQTNSQYRLRGAFVGAGLPALPLVGLGALAIAMLGIGANAALRKR